MDKTAAMLAAEDRLHRPLELALIDLYAALQDWGDVATMAGVSRQTLHVWRRILGIGAATTILRSGEVVPTALPKPCPDRVARRHCPYCGGCESEAIVTCAHCGGAFAARRGNCAEVHGLADLHKT